MSNQNKLIDITCKTYFGIDKEGYVIFKYRLQHDIDTRLISKQEALYVLLELLYRIRTHKIKKSTELSLNITKLNRLIKSDLDSFKKNYSSEILILEKYVDILLIENHIDNTKVIEFNKNFINKGYNLIKFQNTNQNSIKPIQKKEEMPEAPKYSRKEIKKCIDKFNKGDIYEIMGLNPEVTFEKEKTLKNRLADEIIDYNIDLSDLFNLSKNELKDEIIKIRTEQLNQIKKEEENRKILKNITEKIKEFNNQNISEMISQRNNYTDIYTAIIDYDLNFKGIQEFKYYFNNHEELKKLDKLKNKIEEHRDLFIELDSIIQKNNYLTISDIKNIKKQFHNLRNLNSELKKYPKNLKTKFYNDFDKLSYPIQFLMDIFDYNGIYNSENDNLVRKYNENILDEEINNNKEFFKDISDVNKKRAVVIDENNVRVVAGAGTGKTFTIQKKVKFLVEKQGVSPEKILCLCYTNKGASELDIKVNSDLEDSKVEVCTFHEFCRRVDRYCGGNKSTNRYLLDYIIRNYIKEIVDDSEKMSKITEYFSYYITPPLDKEKFDTYDELIELEEAKELTTLKDKYYKVKYTIQSLQGEIVRSLGELIIANYLFMHKIDYHYEKNYGHSFKNILKSFLNSGNFCSLDKICEKTNEQIIFEFIESEERWKRHQPDFYLPEYDLYLEHFGIGRSNNELWLHANYENEMKEKIKCHKMHGTKLIETYYYYLEEGRLIEELEELLRNNNVYIGQRDKKEILDILTTTNAVDDYDKFKKLIKSFINIFEAHNLSKNEFDKFKKEAKLIKNGYDRKRQELFFDIISDIYDIYYEYNNSDSIDHNREISNALELIQSKEYDKSYDYVLIDEYQDINLIRCTLLQELQKNCGCKLFVVGDDWQSIYRFNGSDVNLFIDFNEYFPNSETIILKENRRNPQKIIDISSDFIRKNKNQKEKDLEYYKKQFDRNFKPIKIVTFDWYSYQGKNRILKVDAILRNIYDKNPISETRILLLGRKNSDISKITHNALFREKKDGKYIKILYSRYENADITFMTIHQAKGLEYDEVIILNFENHIAGFPNQIDDDPLLSYVKDYEEYPYAEERRLMYVALTRTLNNVYLLVPDVNESIFIRELREDFKDIEERILPIDRSMERKLWDDCEFFERMEYHGTNLKCPKCDGEITLMVDNKRGTKYFRCSNDLERKSYHYDGGPYNGTIEDLKYVKKCPECRGILVRQGDVLKCCLNNYLGCLETKELKLDKEDKEYFE